MALLLKRSRKINLGKKYKETIDKLRKGDKISYPSLYITDKKLPLEAKQIGVSLTANVKLKFVGISERTNLGGSDSRSYDFEVKEIKFN